MNLYVKKKYILSFGGIIDILVITWKDKNIKKKFLFILKKKKFVCSYQHSRSILELSNQTPLPTSILSHTCMHLVCTVENSTHRYLKLPCSSTRLPLSQIYASSSSRKHLSSLQTANPSISLPYFPPLFHSDPQPQQAIKETNMRKTTIFSFRP